MGVDGGTTRESVARLYRRAAFGLAPGELDELEALGVEATIDRMVDPGAHGIAATPDDLWEGVDLPPIDSAESAKNAIARWLDTFLVTPRPFEEWMAWYWHGHLVSGLSEVGFVPILLAQLNLFRRSALGDLRTLLRETTVDPAMLRYLNGDENTGTAPNENFSRELLELFGLGIGNYTEEDIRTGAKALSGWTVELVGGGTLTDPTRGVARFVPRLHDDTPQTYLGRRGVHDVDTVIDAVVEQEACAAFVAGRFGRSVLGPDADPQLLEELAGDFRDADLDLTVLARGVLTAVAEGRVAELVLGPMPWLVSIQRATGATLPVLDRHLGLFHAGHLPMWPPNVSGWHGGLTWFSASTTAQRFSLAGLVAAASPEDNPARQAAADGDLAALADALGHPEGFSESTTAALSSPDLAPRTDGGVGLLTVALTSPDLVMA